MHKRLSRAVVLLTACLTILGAEVFAGSGGCVETTVAGLVLVRGTGKELKTQYWISVDCDYDPNSDCDVHYYYDLFYTQDGGANWWSMWDTQYDCITVGHDCAGTTYTTWVPTSTTYRTTTGFPADFQSEIWVDKGGCTSGDGMQLDHQTSSKVTITGP